MQFSMGSNSLRSSVPSVVKEFTRLCPWRAWLSPPAR
jgi:hypothetical protein